MRGPGSGATIHWAILVVSSGGLVLLLRWLEVPAAFLLGPLIAAIGLAVRGTSIRPAPIGFLSAQALVGGMIAMSTSLALWIGVAAHWGVYLALAVATLAAATGVGWIMTRRGWLTGTTAVWGLAPGASSAMILMSEAFGGDQRQAAFMQHLRILAVAAAAIGLAHLAGAHGEGRPAVSWFEVGDGGSFVLTLAFVAAAGWLGAASGLPAGALLAPMLLGGILQAAGLLSLTLPPALLAGAYAMIGWRIGLQFTREALVYSARVAPRMAAAIVVLLLACGLIALVLHWLGGIDPLSAWLAVSPGGTDTILIIASATPVDLSFILGAQLTRFLLVLFVGPLIARAASRQPILHGASAP